MLETKIKERWWGDKSSSFNLLKHFGLTTKIATLTTINRRINSWSR